MRLAPWWGTCGCWGGVGGQGEDAGWVLALLALPWGPESCSGPGPPLPLLCPQASMMLHENASPPRPGRPPSAGSLLGTGCSAGGSRWDPHVADESGCSHGPGDPQPPTAARWDPTSPMAQPSPAGTMPRQAGGAEPGTEMPPKVTITLTEVGGREGVAGHGSGGPRATQPSQAPSWRC